ncbi:hypothetical protein Bhyg_08169 [Pseudolycoriella hygida]|uniref:Uncharacterized protein n=1 Tax=Pseudolycoriella hygida TaxID=35572 RepID=A0A9Q0S2Q4_9DIPT|nr:hypothetical protein Bhyg_08169 [Pseudolycoriella hygida]
MKTQCAKLDNNNCSNSIIMKEPENHVYEKHLLQFVQHRPTNDITTVMHGCRYLLVYMLCEFLYVTYERLMTMIDNVAKKSDKFVLFCWLIPFQIQLTKNSKFADQNLKTLLAIILMTDKMLQSQYKGSFVNVKIELVLLEIFNVIIINNDKVVRLIQYNASKHHQHFCAEMPILEIRNNTHTQGILQPFDDQFFINIDLLSKNEDEVFVNDVDCCIHHDRTIDCADNHAENFIASSKKHRSLSVLKLKNKVEYSITLYLLKSIMYFYLFIARIEHADFTASNKNVFLRPLTSSIE